MCVQLVNITKKYNQYTVFENLSLNIKDNGLYFISGKSGCGKTTLLNVIAGYENFDSGERIIKDQTRITMLFQNFELIEELTVKQNIDLYSNLYDQYFDEGNLIIEELGLNNLLECYPNELSHGQQQRVALARSLLCHSDMILCDEPTESLDQTNKEVVMGLLKKLSDTHIIIVVSHDEKLLNQYYDYKYVFKDKNLVSDDIRNDKDEHIVEKKTTYQKKNLLKIVLSLSMKKKRIYTFFLVLLTVLTMLFAYIYVGISHQNMHTLNDHVIYVSKSINGGTPYTVGKSIEKRVQFDFGESITINNKKIYTSIFSLPSTYEELPLLEGSYDNKGIIINQIAAEDIKEAYGKEDILGENITITFKSQSYIKSFTLPITAIVEESEILGLSHIYYPYDLVKDELLNSYITIDGQSESVYVHYRYNEVQKYEVIYPSDENVKDDYNYMLKIYIHCFSDVLDVQKVLDYQRSMMMFVVGVLMVLLIILQIVFITIFSYKDLKKKYSSFVIVHSFSIPIKTIHHYYFMIHVMFYGLVMFIILVGFIVLNSMIISILNNVLSTLLTLNSPWLIDLLFIFISILIYMIILKIVQRCILQKTMISLLKEE